MSPTSPEISRGKLFCDIPDTDDFTLYIKTTNERVEPFLRVASGGRWAPSYEVRIPIHDYSRRLVVACRVLACRCFKGTYWSLTCRREKPSKKPPKRTRGRQRGQSRSIPTTPKETYKPRGLKSPSEYLNGLDEICQSLYDSVFPLKPTSESTGLVVLSGRTASAKTQLARGLIWMYLSNRSAYFKAKRRTPHLLTFEDPIEAYYFDQDRPLDGQELDYTPRQKGHDADSLAQVLNDGLRQTPSVVFVGETREPDEWSDLIGFAGTGHLVFTTAHAGSLSEAMGKIFEATNTRSPSDRAVVADRILALVHVKDGVVEAGYERRAARKRTRRKRSRKKPPTVKRVLIPAVWRSTPVGAKALVAEGRASLLPHSSDGGHSSLGRYRFALELTAKRPVAEGSKGRSIHEINKEVIRAAIFWDLEGL
jgi:hypothetical protein